MPSGDSQRTRFPENDRAVTVELARGNIDARTDQPSRRAWWECFNASEPVETSGHRWLFAANVGWQLEQRRLMLAREARALWSWRLADSKSPLEIKLARWKRSGPDTVSIAGWQTREKS